MENGSAKWKNFYKSIVKIEKIMVLYEYEK